MRPAAHYHPTCLGEKPIEFAVPGDILLDLGNPVLGVSARPPVVLRALMPEAAVDKDSKFETRKDDVRRPAHFWQRPTADVEPEPSAVQDRSEPQFRLGVSVPVGLHIASTA